MKVTKNLTPTKHLAVKDVLTLTANWNSEEVDGHAKGVHMAAHFNSKSDSIFHPTYFINVWSTTEYDRTFAFTTAEAEDFLRRVSKIFEGKSCHEEFHDDYEDDVFLAVTKDDYGEGPCFTISTFVDEDKNLTILYVGDDVLLDIMATLGQMLDIAG